jgi:hypothetical protein
VMLYHNFLIGFSSLLISWLFKQQTHADNSPGWMSNNNVYNNISYTVVVGGGGGEIDNHLVDSLCWGFHSARLFWLPMSGNDSRRQLKLPI